MLVERSQKTEDDDDDEDAKELFARHPCVQLKGLALALASLQ